MTKSGTLMPAGSGAWEGHCFAFSFNKFNKPVKPPVSFTTGLSVVVVMGSNLKVWECVCSFGSGTCSGHVQKEGLKVRGMSRHSACHTRSHFEQAREFSGRPILRHLKHRWGFSNRVLFLSPSGLRALAFFL